MSTAAATAVVILAVINAGSSIGKCMGEPAITETLTLAGIPRAAFLPLAAIQAAGAAGLIVGLATNRTLIATAVSVGFVAYYVLAIARHLHVRYYRGLPSPIAILLIASATSAALLHG